MAQLNDPFIGANWGWDEGEDGWGVGLNETLIQHSFLHNRRIDGIVGTLPDSPTDGQAYFLTSNNRVYFRASGSWYSSNVPTGMDFTLKSTEEKYVFNGSGLDLDTTESSSIVYDNGTSGLTADNVQSAIDEVVVELDNKVDEVTGKQLSTEDYTTAEKTKLSGIAVGATANSSDATLLNRANHTGTQAQSTIVNLETDLASKQTTANLVQDLSIPNSTTYLSTQGLASAFSDIIAGESYQGEWNASTNTPTLTSSVGTEGFYYQVSVAGTTTLDGISSWALGDEVFFNGSVWLKRANYQSVTSVNGQTGPVTLSASDVGAVSSIALAVPTGLEVSGSPVTSSGTITITLQSGYSIPTTANQTLWSTAYTDRNKWDGGATGLVAATGRTSLGLGTSATTNVTTSATDTTSGRVWRTNDLVKTTSATDTTSGSVMLNGVAGLNGAGVLSSDIDTVGVNGFYRGPTSSALGTFPHFIQFGGGDSSNVTQLGGISGTATDLKFRKKIGGTWQTTCTVWHSGNTSSNVQTMLTSADNAAIRNNIGAAKKTVLNTVTSTAHNLDNANESAYHRCTNASAKTVTVRPNSTHALEAGGAWPIRNAGAGLLTIVAGSGVTINPPFGGTLVLDQGMTVVIQKVGTDEYDLIGQTVPA